MEPNVKLETRTTRTTTTTIRSSSGPIVDWQYFKSIPGILKLVQILFAIIAICLATPPWIWVTYFFLFVCYVCLFLTVFFAAVYFFSLHHKVTVRPSWISMEFYYTIGATFFYAIIMILEFSVTSNYDKSNSRVATAVAAAVFALFNTIAYGIGLFVIFTEWRNWRNSRGAIPVSRG